MKKRLPYTSPELHVAEFRAEGGFALSTGTGAFEEGGSL